MDEITEEPAALTERVAALDIGKAVLTACVRVLPPAQPRSDFRFNIDRAAR